MIEEGGLLGGLDDVAGKLLGQEQGLSNEERKARLLRLCDVVQSLPASTLFPTGLESCEENCALLLCCLVFCARVKQPLVVLCAAINL